MQIQICLNKQLLTTRGFNMDLKQLREQRAENYTKAKGLLDNWTADKSAEYDALINAIDAIDADISRSEGLVNREVQSIIEKSVDDLKGMGNNEVVIGAFEKYLRKGKEGLSNSELTTLMNVQVAGTPAAGGFTVPKILIPNISLALKAFGGIRERAQVITTDSGEAWDYPNTDATGQVGALVTEIQSQAGGADYVIGNKNLATYNWTSNPLAVSKNLIQDSAVDIVSFVNARLLERIARVHAQYFVNGTGTAQPEGLLAVATAGKVGTTGQTLSITYDDLVDLEHSVDVAYRDSCSFVMNDLTWKAIRKVKDTTGRPLLYGDDKGLDGQPVRTLFSYPVVICNDMPVMAANAKSIIFGDLSRYVIRDVNGFQVMQFNEMVYASVNQTAFMANTRMGAIYTDIGNSIKFYQNSAT
jgi:HK97 family phage major capsid protein